MATRLESLSTIKIEGAILPPDLLRRIADGDLKTPGLRPDDYHLAKGERLNEATNRAWNRLVGAWAGFRAQAERLPEGDAGTTLTRERWLLILFQELGYGRLPVARAFEIGGRSYPISHAWQQTPIHLVSLRQSLDRRTPGARGAARVSPHSLMQELLNRSDDHQWGIVSNGESLRILRDNASLSRAAYIEFDLKAMMEGEVYADFALLWLLAHQSRFEAPEGKGPEDCWLERWFKQAAEEGTRVLDHLRQGVEQAIEALGGGFLSHGANRALRGRIESGELTAHGYYQQLLRTVYRLLFLFVAEDRGLVLAPNASDEARLIFTRYYSTRRLRDLADRRRGTIHADLYRGLRVVLSKLQSASRELGLPALGGFLFSPEAAPDLDAAQITNYDFLDTIRHLAYMSDNHGKRPVDYRNLGAEELGSVYESLLEQHPSIDGGRSFKLEIAAGSERKTTGSYYTPSSLIQCLLESALDPVIEEAASAKDTEAAERALLALRICDPACGSGHFLVAAARRLAKAVAAARTGEEEPAPEAMGEALRDVIGRCIYGVDVNPMAVELCKINLWMEALVPGKPLSFLDHHIQCGNSLLGTTPALLEAGIPDEAFAPIEGDDSKVCSALKKQNRSGPYGTQPSLLGDRAAAEAGDFTETFAHLSAAEDATPEARAEKERRYEAAVGSEAYRRARLAADAWCAAFVWVKDGTSIGSGIGAVRGITTDLFRRLQSTPEEVAPAVRAEIARLREQYGFFHWHLAFPEVFRVPAAGEAGEPAGWTGGFDVVLGNPPWEHTELKEKEWFATRCPRIAEARTGAARKRMIEALAADDPALLEAFRQAKRAHDAIGTFVGSSGRCPLCGRGRINTYAVFAELMRTLTGPTGRTGCIIPSGIATDDTTKFFFQDLMDRRSLVSLYDFENRDGIFAGVHRSFKFCLLTLAGRERPVAGGAEFVFFAHRTEQLKDEDRWITLSAEDLALLNPNTRTCPVFRSRKDAELTKWIYRRVPVLIKEGPPEENPWGIRFKQGLFNMTSDSHLFRTREELERDGWVLEGNRFVRPGAARGARAGARSQAEAGAGGAPSADDWRREGQASGGARGAGRETEVYLPLYEAKMIHHFDHRWATYESTSDGPETRELTPAEKADPNVVALPRYWVPAEEVDARLEGKWEKEWLLGWRDICRSTDERTVIAGVVPRVGVGHTLPLLLASVGPADAACLQAALSSFVFDFVARQKVGGTHLTYGYLDQLPVLRPAVFAQPSPWAPKQTLRDWLLPRVLEVTYTSAELAPFARECGCDGPPFAWDDERRFQLRCELDAAFFHLYLGSASEWMAGAPDDLKALFPTLQDAVGYIMETFPIVKAADERAWGNYRTRDVILEAYAADETSGARPGR